MRYLYQYVLLATSLLIFSACGENQSEQEQETAFQDYRNFVTQVERDAGAEFSDTELTELERRAMQQAEGDTTWWRSETAAIQQQYDEHRRRLEPNLQNYDEARQKEIADLEQRYNRASQQQEEKYRDISRRYALRRQLLGMEVETDDFSNVDQRNIADTYQRFVNRVENNKENFDDRDWELIEGWWVTLNNRKRAVEDNLNRSAVSTIEQAQQRYRQVTEITP